MKQLLVMIVSITLIVSVVVFVFTLRQVALEQQRLEDDLAYKTSLIAENIHDVVESRYATVTPQELHDLGDHYIQTKRISAVFFYDREKKIIAVSGKVPADKLNLATLIGAKETGVFLQSGEVRYYGSSLPIAKENEIQGYVVALKNGSYINGEIQNLWKYNLLRLIVQTTLISTALFFLLRWAVYEPVRYIVESLQLARAGVVVQKKNAVHNKYLFFRPLFREVGNITKAIFEARSIASEEARLRLEKIDSPWTAQRLKEFTKSVMDDRTLVIASNREPYIHTKKGKEISYYFPASGMITAVDPIMQACGGMWVAQASGDADKLVVDRDDKIMVPPDEPKYTLKRIWLTKEEEEGFYNGFANEGIWPLCHNAHTRPIFRKRDWEAYNLVNEKFADAILDEIAVLRHPVVVVQDYQLAVLPRMLKKRRPDLAIGIFWHIPWPNAESFSICPWKNEIVDGLLGADLIGFHTQLHCNNFIETVGRGLESLVDLEQFTVTRSGHTSYIKPFPISIAFSNGGVVDPEKKPLVDELFKNHVRPDFIGVGVDRLDYTKGILERIRSIEMFFELYPAYRGRMTFIQMSEPSRTKIKKYQEFSRDVEDEINRVNKALSQDNWQPIVLSKRHHTRDEVDDVFRQAHFCLVTSLHDGMNLVAKEYAAARTDEQGVLILSQFTGASRELKQAIPINPYDAEEVAKGIYTALTMTHDEQRRRMQAMRNSIKHHNVYQWSAEFLKTLTSIG